MKTHLERTNALSGESIDQELGCRWLMKSVVVNRDLSMGIGWKVTFPYLPTASEDSKVSFHNNFRALLNSLGENFDLQVIFDQSHNPSSLMKVMTETLPKAKIARELVIEKAKLLEASFHSGALRNLHCYVILVRRNPLPSSLFIARAEKIFAEGVDGKKPSFVAKAANKIKGIFLDSGRHYQFEQAEFDQAHEQLIQCAESIQSDLAQMRLEPELMLNDDVIELFYRFWNPKSYDQGGIPKKYDEAAGLPLTDYFLYDSTGWEPHTDPRDKSSPGVLSFDGMKHAIMTVRTPASPMEFTQWDDLLLHRGMHSMQLVVNIQQDSVRKRISFLKDHRLPQFRAAAAKDPSMQSALTEVETELVALGEGREKIWRATHVIHLWAPTGAELEQMIQGVRKYGEEKHGMILSAETDAVWEYWRFCQPFWTRDTDRHRDIVYNTTQLVTQLPVVGQTTFLKGKKKGAIMETTAGTVFNTVFHENSFANANGIVIGGSGTGKSFLVNLMLTEMSASDPIVVIVDLGGSFRGMCEVQGGTYIDYDVKSKSHCINPLALPAGVAPDPVHLDTMLTFLEKLMVDPSRDIGGRLASEQFSLMEKALNQLILKSNGKEFFLHDFKEVIGNPSFPGGDKLAMRLSPWCRGQGGMPSRFGNLFDGPTQIDLSNPFTVFDLTKIKDNPELGGVMFSTILRQVSLVGALFPGRQKFLVFDECWSFLQDPVVAQFVVYAYRALRKVGFSTIGISQGIEEFQKTSNRDAIIGNIAHLLILRQNSTQSAQGLGEQFQLTETETNIITKLKTEKGHFSQCLVSQVLSDGRRQSVLTLNRPSALSYWTSTTHAPDKGIIAKYRDEGMGYLDALVRLSKEYPHGVEGGKADLAKAA